jgi:hypothetical protein
MAAGLVAGCGDGSTEADRLGVGAECTESAECESPDENIMLECLTQFTGGYCGLEGCEEDADCPEGSACVTADDGKNYCYRLCQDKDDCNRNRPQNPANCVGSGTINFVDQGTERKACEPPSSGM